MAAQGRLSRAFDAKVGLRVRAVALAGDAPRVLDCFAGEGAVWREVRSRCPSVVVEGVELDPARAAVAGAAVGDNMAVLRSRDLSSFSLVDLDAFGWPDRQLDVLAWRRAGDLPVVTVTCCGTMIGRVPKLVRDAAGIPAGWPEGVVSRAWAELWTLFTASLGWRVHERLVGRRRGGAWVVYETLVPA